MVAQQQERAAVLVAFVAAGLMVCGTGCSGGGAAAQDARTGSGTVGTLREAVSVLERAGSAKASTSMEMATGGTRVTIRGQGAYDFRKQTGWLKVLLPQDPAGAAEHRPITELLAPGALFMKNRGAGVPADKWVRVATAGLTDGNLVTGGATDPYAAAELLRGARSVTYVGRTEVAGIPVRHHRGTADLEAAARSASAAQRPALTAAAKGFATTAVPFDAYVDDQGRLRKVRYRFSFVNGQRKGTVAVASTLLLYDFGAPAVVRLPEPSDIYAGKIAE
ncbi:hypothetical protein [Streptomyces triticiradicis]|uniref:LppX_LprAFG lipoprotein n=1 Tax=Streptomyces triticiradicis TaxID=2651189 RepID=A0A7J5D8B5_9ACTN|nr:hypothetical protein [Streptomyces triticiradicis]KAB1982368.1 hypothetical protein F8144_30920 [Streptomyces triticiradicis]